MFVNHMYSWNQYWPWYVFFLLCALWLLCSNTFRSNHNWCTLTILGS